MSITTNNSPRNPSDSIDITLLEELLRSASLNNLVESAMHAISNDVNINCLNELGQTPLHLAAEKNNPEMIKFLLDNKADVLIKNSAGYTAFQIAAKTGNDEALKAILDSLALNIDYSDVLNTTVDGKTPLMLAVENNHRDATKLLLNNGADVHIKDNDGNTAIILASAMGPDDSDNTTSLKIAKLLLAKRSEHDNTANIHDKNSLGYTALRQAIKMKDHFMVTLLLNNEANLNDSDNDKESILMYASTIGNIEILETLITRGADIKYVDEEGNTALHKAAEFLKPENLDLLIQKGADVNAQNRHEQTPIMKSLNYINNEALATVQMLKKNGADLNITDVTKKTALMLSCEKFKGSNNPTNLIYVTDENRDNFKSARAGDGHENLHYFNLTKELVTQENISKQDIDGKTIFHKAICNNKFYLNKFFEYLNEKGINFDLEIKNNAQETPLISATKHGCSLSVPLLLQKGAKINPDFWIALTSDTTLNKKLTAENLLAYKTPDNDNIFHLAIINSSFQNIQKFLTYLKDNAIAFNLETKNNLHETPLIKAAKSNRFNTNDFNIFSILKDFGANVNSQDNNGWTPLIHASKKGIFLSVAHLLELNADITKRTSSAHWDALTFASSEGYSAIVGELLNYGAKESTSYRATMAAAQNNQVDCLRELLNIPEIKANINNPDQLGMTPLMYAAKDGYVDSLRILIEYGADYHLQGTIQGHKLRALDCAAANGRVDAANYLAQLELDSWFGKPINNIKTALFGAAICGKNDVITNLLDLVSRCRYANVRKEVNINCFCVHTGATLLHRACENGHTATVSMLLQKGASANAQMPRSDFYWGKSPLMCAAEIGSLEIIELLLAKPECLNHINEQNSYHKHWSAIEYAINLGHTKAVELLQEKGARLP